MTPLDRFTQSSAGSERDPGFHHGLGILRRFAAPPFRHAETAKTNEGDPSMGKDHPFNPLHDHVDGLHSFGLLQAQSFSQHACDGRFAHGSYPRMIGSGGISNILTAMGGGGQMIGRVVGR